MPRREGHDFDYHWGLVIELYGSRKFQEALEMALEVERNFPDKWGEISLGIASICARLGQFDSAVSTLEKAMSNGHWWSKNELLQIPALRPLHERLDFCALVEKCDSLQRAREESSRPELIVFTPEDGSIPRTAIITLHGRGETAQTFAPHWKRVVSIGILLAVPGSSQPFRSEGLCWDDHERARKEITGVYSQLLASYPKGFDHTIVAGYSQGGELALSLAIIPEFTCTGFIGVAPGPFSQAKLEELTNALETAAPQRLKGYLFSGDKDPTLPMTMKIHEEMTMRHIQCEFKLEAGAGHSYPRDFELRLVSAVKFVLS